MFGTNSNRNKEETIMMYTSLTVTFIFFYFTVSTVSASMAGLFFFIGIIFLVFTFWVDAYGIYTKPNEKYLEKRVGK